jgi:hypothetical protein
MTEYSRIAKGSFTAAAATGVIPLPFKPDFVEIFNYTNIAAGAAASKCLRAWWDASLIVSSNNPTMVECYTAGSVTAFDVISNTSTNQGINAYSAGQLLQFGPSKQVVASTKGSTTSFQVTSHGFVVGDTVMFEGLYQSATTGMAQMNGVMFTITTITDANNFIVNWNSNNSSYTNLSASPTGAVVKKVLYPFLYAPQVSVITAITTGSTTTIQTADYHNLVVGQEIAFRIPSQWGSVQLNSLPNSVTPGSPIYAYVTSITDNWTFVCNFDSSAATAFTTAVSVSSVPGLTMPQVVAIGDVNTGGNGIFAGSALYPSPRFPTSSNRVSTINGPAILGAFVNNTSQGFTIGAGVGTNNASVSIMAANDVIEWRAYLHDFSSP